jgi:choline-sulfatase
VASESRVVRLGEASALALAAALICALPTAFRAIGAGGGVGDGLLVGTAVMLCFMLPVAMLLPPATRGFHAVAGKAPSRALWIGIAIWIGVSIALLVPLAAVLKAKTNHRGLGGATFGVFGAACVAGAAVLAARLTSVGQSLLERGWSKRLLLVIAATISVAPLLLLVSPMIGGDGAPLRAALFDLLLAATVAIFVFRLELPKALAGQMRKAALPLTLSLVVVGFVRVETSPPSATAVKKAGGLPATVLWVLGAWSDQDGDGFSAHFGGNDCDEGDPRRYPGAPDTPGDGFDSDCDGADGTPVAVKPAPRPTVAASAATVAAKAPAKFDKPDVVLISLDTVRADRTSVYGYAKDTTPTLNKLAQRGTVFEHAYATGSDTQRALIPVVSGLPLSKTARTTKEWPRLRDEVETVAERLSAVGYAAGAVTSFTWLRNDRGFGQGFIELDESAWSARHPEREHTGDLATKAAVEMYGALSKKDGPVFLWLHLFDAHAKYVEHAGIDFGGSDSSRYDGEINFIDQQLSTLIQAVEAAGRFSRTIWIVHGTHGEAFGEHGQVGHGVQLFDESVRVPLFIVHPASKPRRFDADAVSVLDVAPTLLDFAGASVDGVHGVSLRRAVEGDEDFNRPPVFTYARGRVAVVDWPLKLMVFRRKKRDDRLLLFDLKADPSESKDLSAERKEDLGRLDVIRRETDR